MTQFFTATLFVLVSATSFAKDTSEKKFYGHWKGYCEPIGDSNTSRLCSFEFSENGEGSFRCSLFGDIRCEKTLTKETKKPFKFKIQDSTNEKAWTVRIDYTGTKDWELCRLSLNGDVLMQTAIETNDADGKTIKAPAGWGPKVWFSRDK